MLGGRRQKWVGRGRAGVVVWGKGCRGVGERGEVRVGPGVEQGLSTARESWKLAPVLCALTL